MKPQRVDFEILGKPWHIRLLKKKKYKRTNGSDSVAVADTNKCRIDLGPDGRDRSTLIHELVHAYLAELCLHSAELDTEALEEVFAELMAKRGEELLALADRLHAEISTPTKLLVASGSGININNSSHVPPKRKRL